METSASTTSVNFPSECIEDIFQHLDYVEDFLKCTLVYPSWNEYIGSSRWCMGNICIKCSTESRLDDLKNVLMNSKRKYKFIYVTGVYSDKMVEVLSLNITWSHIFSTLQFMTVTDVFDFLQNIRTSIQKLSLYRKIVQRDVNPEIKSLGLQFP